MCHILSAKLSQAEKVFLGTSRAQGEARVRGNVRVSLALSKG